MKLNKFIKVCCSIPDDKFMVDKFIFQEYLSLGYRGNLVLYSNEPFSVFKNLLRQPIRIIINHFSKNNETRYFNGIVVAINGECVLQGQYNKYHLRLISEFELLNFKKIYRGFCHLSAIDAIRKILLENKLRHVNYKNVTGVNSIYNFSVQYAETDYEYINRICSENALYYYFKHGENETSLHFFDRWYSEYCSDYLYEDKITKAIYANQSCVGFMVDDISAHLNIGMISKNKCLTKFFHYMYRDVEGDFHYKNRATWITYQSLQNLHQRRFPSTKIYGVQKATVLSQKMFSSESTTQVCVKVRFHWPGAKNEITTQSNWIKVAQPIAGKNIGMQWLPRAGSSVLLAFVDADPSQPLIIGSLYDEMNPPIFSCQSKLAYMGFQSSYNQMVFDYNKTSPALKLTSQGGMTTKVNGKLTTMINDGYQTTIAGDYKLTVSHGRYMVKANQYIRLQVGNSHIEINQKGIYLRANKIYLN